MTQHQPNVSSQRPGQMTAVMRAMPQSTGPKVLRIGLVQGGKVIEERVIKQRSTVTVGPSEKSTFVLPNKSLPPSFKLFELVGNEYALNFLEGMTGRVALKTGISDLSALRAQSRRSQQGSVAAYQVSLSEEARGKVVVGETTFLFQFVAPPPMQPRPQLPVSVRSGLDIDWTTTIIAAFSFLFHFGLIGSIYSDWMDPPIDDGINVDQLIESVKALPPPPAVEEQKDIVDTPATATAASTAASEAPKSTGGASKGTGGQKMSDSRADRISSELAALDVQMLAVLNSQGTSTDRILTNSDMPLGLLEDAANSNSARGDNRGIAMPGSGYSGRPGEGGKGGLQDLANKGAGEKTGTAGTAAAVKGPTGNVGVGGPSQSGGSVANAGSVVAGMSAGFRRCYNRGLAENPDMKGSIRITAKIGPNGEVLGASPSASGSLSGTVVSCVVARVSSAQFSPPEGGGATLVIPVSFNPQP